MEKREKPDQLVLTLTALFLFLILFSSTALAANNMNALAYQGNYEEAIKAYDKTIGINPQESDAWINKGTCLLATGNFTEAMKAYDKQLKLILKT